MNILFYPQENDTTAVSGAQPLPAAANLIPVKRIKILYIFKKCNYK